MRIFQFKSLLSQKNIIHGVSTKKFGSIKNLDNSINVENLGNFLSFLNLPLENAVKMRQTHSGNVAIVKRSKDNMYDDTDGLITSEKHTPIYVLTADCLPIFFYDPKKQVVGIGHGGRRGLQNKIIENMILKFKSDFDSDVKDILIGIGPGIEKKCYEVDSELMDIAAMAKKSLLDMGIVYENIEFSNICTKCDKDNYFSYRGGDEYERFVSVISLI